MPKATGRSDREIANANKPLSTSGDGSCVFVRISVRICRAKALILVPCGVKLGNYGYFSSLLLIDEIVSKVHWQPGGVSARKHIKITGVLQSALWFL